jgi:hypothetical protein
MSTYCLYIEPIFDTTIQRKVSKNGLAVIGQRHGPELGLAINSTYSQPGMPDLQQMIMVYLYSFP